MEIEIIINTRDADPVTGLTINDAFGRSGDKYLYDIEEVSPGIYIPLFKDDVINAIEKSVNDIVNNIF